MKKNVVHYGGQRHFSKGYETIVRDMAIYLARDTQHCLHVRNVTQQCQPSRRSSSPDYNSEFSN